MFSRKPKYGGKKYIEKEPFLIETEDMECMFVKILNIVVFNQTYWSNFGKIVTFLVLIRFRAVSQQNFNIYKLSVKLKKLITSLLQMLRCNHKILWLWSFLNNKYARDFSKMIPEKISL